MSIYIPFTYIIGWSKHKQFYYGCKFSKGCCPSDLWTTYFTSSKYVREFIKENGEPDIVKIHRIFSDKDSCVSKETQYLTKIDVKNNPLFLNKHNGRKGFDAGGTVSVKDSNGNTFRVSVEDQRYISGELVHHTKNTAMVIDCNGKRFRVNVDDPRYLSGELKSNTIGKVIVKDKKGNCFSVSKNDPRYLSGELVSIHKNAVVVKDKHGISFSVSKNDPRYLSGELVHVSTGIKYPEKICPHCNKIGRGPNMTRYHFDNCKLKSVNYI